MSRRVAVLVVGLTLALFGSAGAARPPRSPTPRTWTSWATRSLPRRRRGTRPTGSRESPRSACSWTYADAQRRRRLQARRRRRATTPRPTPTGRAPTTPTTSRARPSSTCATGGRPAPTPAGSSAYELLRGARVPADRRGAERGQRRAVDAARRHAATQRRPGRAARPVGLGTRSYWLARTIWALGEGYAAFRARRPRVRGVPARPARRSRSARSTARCSMNYGAAGPSTACACPRG